MISGIGVFFTFALVTCLPGILLAQLAQFPFLQEFRGRSRKQKIITTLALAFLSFAITFLIVTRYEAQVGHVTPKIIAQLGGEGFDYPPEVSKEEIIKELWLRGMMLPIKAACFANHAGVCDFADRYYASDLHFWAWHLLFSLASVGANTWMIRRLEADMDIG